MGFHGHELRRDYPDRRENPTVIEVYKIFRDAEVLFRFMPKHRLVHCVCLGPGLDSEVWVLRGFRHVILQRKD